MFQNKEISMARKLNIKFNKTTLFILIAIAVILALLVALAFSPVGTGLLEGLNGDNGSQTTDNSKLNIQLGSNVTSSDNTTILETITAKIHFIDVGQGDAILCQFQDGTDVLIDGGSNTSGLDQIRDDFMDYLFSAGITDTIEYMIVTHPDTDHYNMLTMVLDTYDVETIYYNNTAKGTQYTDFINRIGEEVSGNNNVGLDADGEIYEDVIKGTGYSFDIYAPGYDRFQDENADYDAYESNGMSPIVVLEVSGKKVLLTGDATHETEAWFLETLGETALDVDVLKVGHHGSESSTTQTFLDKVSPEFAVISCDDGTKHSHPRPEVMNRLFDDGIVTYRTNRHGDIVLLFDANGNFAFQVEKQVMVENNTKNVNDKMLVTSVEE